MSGLNLSGFSKPEDLQGMDRVSPGWYHAVIMAIDESREKTAGLGVQYAIAHGTDATQMRKTFNSQDLKDPTPDQEDWQQLARIAAQANLALACGIITPAQLGPGNENVIVPWQAAIGRQIILHLVESKPNADGKVYTNIANYGKGIYSITDPKTATVPKAINIIPPAIQQQLAAQSAAAGGNGQGAQQPVAQQPVAQQQPAAVQQSVQPAYAPAPSVAAQPVGGGAWAGL